MSDAAGDAECPDGARATRVFEEPSMNFGRPASSRGSHRSGRAGSLTTDTGMARAPGIFSRSRRGSRSRSGAERRRLRTKAGPLRVSD